MASDPDIDGVVGGLLVASGVLVAVLGGLCTSWIMVPETVRRWNADRLAELRYDWAVVAGGGLTVTVGTLMIRAGLRRLRA